MPNESIINQWYLNGMQAGEIAATPVQSPAMVRCSVCNQPVNSEQCVNVVGYEAYHICERCTEQHFFTCRVCGKTRASHSKITVSNGQVLCLQCASSSLTNYHKCSNCHTWHYDETASPVNPYYCPSCVANSWECSRCHGRQFGESNTMFGDDERLCNSCISLISSEMVHQYNYKPEPVFHGATRLTRTKIFYGLEIETVRKNGESQKPIRTYNLLKIVNSATDGDLAYLKNDGSVNYGGDHGFEMVTHPATYEYLRDSEPFKKALAYLEGEKYYSHDTDCCGLHIHFSRKTFGSTDQERADNVMKLLFVFEKHWDNLVKFSRRTEENLYQWANRYSRSCHVDPPRCKDTAKRFYDRVKDTGNRYSCVNLCNSNTIEIRIFRGTLKWTTVMASIQLVRQFIIQCMAHSIDEIVTMTWEDLFLDAPQELMNYLISKELCVADPEQRAEAKRTEETSQAVSTLRQSVTRIPSTSLGQAAQRVTRRPRTDTTAEQAVAMARQRVREEYDVTSSDHNCYNARHMEGAELHRRIDEAHASNSRGFITDEVLFRLLYDIINGPSSDEQPAASTF